KEMSVATQDQQILEVKLNNPGFTGKAPAAVVAKEREKLEGILARKGALAERLKELKQNS
ncbi:MAG: hypothetical protein Q8911_15820, partial [Bacillota bacterium]|nr:hypothetical protein [Bacillota bacterium]